MFPPLDNPQLEAWLQAAGSGDSAAFSRLAKTLGPRLHAQATRLMGGNAAAADDVLQEALIKLWQTAPRWQPGGSVGAYASKLVFTVAMDHHRKAVPTTDEIPEQPVEESSTHHIFEAQRRRHVTEALNALPPRQKEAVSLAYFFDNKTKDVAHEMGLSEKAADALLVRARRLLAKTLSPELLEESA